jgi:hypothetical protein
MLADCRAYILACRYVSSRAGGVAWLARNDSRDRGYQAEPDQPQKHVEATDLRSPLHAGTTGRTSAKFHRRNPPRNKSPRQGEILAGAVGLF